MSITMPASWGRVEVDLAEQQVLGFVVEAADDVARSVLPLTLPASSDSPPWPRQSQGRHRVALAA